MVTIDSSILQRPDQFWQCPHCDGRLRRVETLLNSVGGKAVRVFKCADCTKLIWDD